MSKNYKEKVITICGLQILLTDNTFFGDYPSLMTKTGDSFAISIKRSTYTPKSIPFFAHIYDNDIYVSNSFFEIRYNGTSLLQVNTTNEPWVATFNENVSVCVCEELFLKIVIPYYYYTQNAGIPLHATTVKHGLDLFCIMGESYSGKSTLAYYLLQDDEFDLLSDDVTPIRVSSDTNKKICAYNGSNKLKIRKETALFFSTNTLLITFSHNAIPKNNYLKCIFFIKPTNEEQLPSIRLCSKIESRCLLLKNLYASYLQKLDSSIIQMIDLICDKVKIYELNYFKDFSQLNTIKNILINQMEHVND